MCAEHHVKHLTLNLAFNAGMWQFFSWTNQILLSERVGMVRILVLLLDAQVRHCFTLWCKDSCEYAWVVLGDVTSKREFEYHRRIMCSYFCIFPIQLPPGIHVFLVRERWKLFTAWAAWILNPLSRIGELLKYVLSVVITNQSNLILTVHRFSTSKYVVDEHWTMDLHSS